MDLPASLFPDRWHGVSLVLADLILFLLARSISWAPLLRSGIRLNLLFGLAVCLAFLWSLRAGIHPGLNFHLLGAMAACLILGRSLAIVALGLALVGITLNGVVEWRAWPLNFLLMAVAPVVIADWLSRIVARALPHHFFVFVFVGAFAGSAASIVLQGLAASWVLVLAGAYPWAFLADNYLPYLALLGFSEAWIGGGIITLLVVYKPEWVAAFDERRYLAR